MSLIKRKPRRDPFTRVDRNIAQDSRLSFGARGLATYILSLPEDWKLNLTDLTNRSPAGKHTVRKLMNELMEYGYVTRERARAEGGKMAGYDYTLHEDPTVVRSTDDGNTDDGNTDVGNTDVGESNTTIETAVDEKQVEDKNRRKGDAKAPLSPKAKARKMLEYWNANCRPGKTRALTADSYLDPITARIKDGASAQDCVDVIKDRALEWLADNPEMAKNFRITTLFRKKHFTVYLDNWHDRTAMDKARIKDLPSFVANPPKRATAKLGDQPSKAKTLQRSPFENRRRKPASSAVTATAENFKA